MLGPPRVLGIWEEWPFIFRELESTGYFFRGAREQAHNFWDIGSLAKKQKQNKEKPSFCLIFKKIFCLSKVFRGSMPPDPPPPPATVCVHNDTGPPTHLLFLLSF